MSGTRKVPCPHCGKDIHIFLPLPEIRINRAYHEGHGEKGE